MEKHNNNQWTSKNFAIQFTVHIDLYAKSESWLRKTFRPKKQNIQKQISDIKSTNQMLVENFSNINVFTQIRVIPSTLIIDAFTVSAITPYSKTKFFEKSKKQLFFISYCATWSEFEHFSNVENGNATLYTQECITCINKQQIFDQILFCGRRSWIFK